MVENSIRVTTGTHHTMELYYGPTVSCSITTSSERQSLVSLLSTSEILTVPDCNLILPTWPVSCSILHLRFQRGSLEFRSLELWCPGCHFHGTSKRHSHNRVPPPWKAVFASEQCMVPDFYLLPEFLKIPLYSHPQGKSSVFSSTSSHFTPQRVLHFKHLLFSTLQKSQRLENNKGLSVR